MTGMTKGPWIAVGAMVESPRDDIADICSCNPAVFGQDAPHLKARSYAEMIANAEAIAEIPAMVQALRAMHDAADDFAEHGKERHLHALRAAMDRAAAILSRIDGAGDTLPDAPAPAPTASARDDLPALLSDLSGFLAGFDGCEFNGEAVESLQARIAAQVGER